MSDVRELIIVGGGPAGYTAALYAARANLRPLVIEGLRGGRAAHADDARREFPGHSDGIMGPDLMAQMRRAGREVRHRDYHRGT